MSREFSKAAQNYPPSGIRKMFDLATQYPDAIKLTVGEPNFDTPAYIKEAAKKAMDAGETTQVCLCCGGRWRRGIRRATGTATPPTM